MMRQAADGHHNAAGLQDLHTIDDTGMSTRGIHYARYVDLADGSVMGKGTLVEEIEFVNLTPAEYVALLGKWGLSTAYEDVSNDVTYRTLGPDLTTWTNYNGTVVHRKGLDTLFEEHVYQFARFTIKKLVAI